MFVQPIIPWLTIVLACGSLLSRKVIWMPDSYWYSGEPDNPVGDGNCVLLGRMMYDAYLYDTGCDSNRNFICEKP